MNDALITSKTCSACKTSKPVADFYKDKKAKDGLKSQCKKCHCISSVLSRDPDKHREYNKNWMRRSKYATREEVKERELSRSRVRNLSFEHRARKLANNAVALGFLVRPDQCSECHGFGMGIHAHHEDYTQPLNVIWLCTECHGKRHRLKFHNL
jgi:hypothetical protein